MKKSKSTASPKSAAAAKLPALRRESALQPTELSAAAQQAADDLMREGASENTEASYRAALRYWAAWYGARYGLKIELPVPVACVIQFIVDHAQRKARGTLRHELPEAIDLALVQAGVKGKPGPMAINTLRHRLAVLSKAHQLTKEHKAANPCRDMKVRDLMHRTRNAFGKRGEVANKKDALTRDPLQVVLDGCDESLKGKRDRALLLFAWASGGRRRSEVAAADMKFLKKTQDGYTYYLGHSKTNQAGKDQPENYKPIQEEAAEALADWLAASGITTGPIFRRVLKGGHLKDKDVRLGAPLTAGGVFHIVTQRCLEAGLEGDYSPHSLRSGFVTEAGIQDVPLKETMAMSSHVNVQTVLGYMRTTDTSKSRAARLFGAKRKSEEP